MRSSFQTLRVPSAARTTAATTTTYYQVDTDIMVKAVTVMGVNPAAQDGDTVRVIVDHSANSDNTYTTIADTTADEYNDTQDTASLGVAGTAPDVRTVGSTDWGTISFPGTRVGGDSHLRVREIWTGTVTDGQVQIAINYEPLNDTVDPGA